MSILLNIFFKFKDEDDGWIQDQECARMNVQQSDENNGTSPNRQESTSPPAAQNGLGANVVHFADTDRHVEEQVKQAEYKKPKTESIPQAVSKITECKEHELPEYAEPRNDDAGLSQRSRRSAIADVQSPFVVNGNMAEDPWSLDDIELPSVSMQELEYCELAYRKLGSGLDTTVYRGLFRGVQRQLAVTQYSRITAEDEVVFEKAACQSQDPDEPSGHQLSSNILRNHAGSP